MRRSLSDCGNVAVNPSTASLAFPGADALAAARAQITNARSAVASDDRSRPTGRRGRAVGGYRQQPAGCLGSRGWTRAPAARYQPTSLTGSRLVTGQWTTGDSTSSSWLASGSSACSRWKVRTSRFCVLSTVLPTSLETSGDAAGESRLGALCWRSPLAPSGPSTPSHRPGSTTPHRSASAARSATNPTVKAVTDLTPVRALRQWCI